MEKYKTIHENKSDLEQFNKVKEISIKIPEKLNMEDIQEFLDKLGKTKIKIMKWTEPKPPTEGVSYYNHTICETPLGKLTIEWKSWKETPSYDVMIEDEWICCEYSLENAKEKSLNFIVNKKRELDLFLDL